LVRSGEKPGQNRIRTVNPEEGKDDVINNCTRRSISVQRLSVLLVCRGHDGLESADFLKLNVSPKRRMQRVFDPGLGRRPRGQGRRERIARIIPVLSAMWQNFIRLLASELAQELKLLQQVVQFAWERRANVDDQSRSRVLKRQAVAV
jgi:hypothetical protein